MATGLNVGTIYYEVESDTSKLVNSSGEVDSSLDRMNRQFSRTDKAANSAQFQMTKTAAAVKGLGRESDAATAAMRGLSGVIAGLVTLQGARGLIEMAEAYNEMAERVRMATSSQQEYELVQQRLLNTANKTYRSLAEAQEVYIRTADTLRSMGYTTAEALDITDSLSYSFVKNATSVDRANSAIGAFTKAANKGKVEADAWESILAAVPSVINDIATASGKTAAEIRQMGVSGEISARMLNEGLRQSLESNRAAADGMATTLKDAFTALRNNLSAYVGEANQASGATGVLSSAVLALGNNLDTIVKLLMAAGAGALAKYVAQLTASALAQAKAALAARAHAAEELRAAQAQERAAAAAAGQAAANLRLGGSHAEAAAAARAHRVATDALNAAQARSAGVGATLLGILGGPAGIVALVASAAAGFLLFGTNVGTARRSTLDLGVSLDELIKKFRELGELQRAKELSTLGDLMAEQTRKASMAVSEFADDLQPSLEKGARGAAQFRAQFRSELQGLVSDTSLSASELEAAVSALIDRWAEQHGWTAQTVLQYKAAAAEMVTTQAAANNTSQKIAALRVEQERLAGATSAAAAAQRDLNSAFDDAQTDDYLKKLKDRKAAIEDGNSAVKAAERYIKSLNNVSPERIEAIRAEAKAVDAATAAQSRYKAGASSSTKAANEQKTAEEQNQKAIAGLAEQLYLAGLNGEALAVAKAKASLNAFATPEEIANLEGLARALYEVQQAQSQRQVFGATAADANQYIMGNVSPLSGGAFDDQVARYEAEAQAEEKRYADQLARLQKARELQIETGKSYDQIEEDAARQHADRMNQIEQAKYQVMLGSAADGLGAIADLMRESKGEQSGAYKAMFAVSKAFAIAQAALNLGTAMGNAWQLPWPANIAAAATAAASMATIIAGIQSVSMASGRQYGGPVAPGQMHRINENGQPEILNTASGRQYLLPNTRGEVVSNKDASGGGQAQAPRVTVIVNNAPPGTQVEQNRVSDEEYIVNVMLADAAGEGRFTRYNQSIFGLRRRGQ